MKNAPGENRSNFCQVLTECVTPPAHKLDNKTRIYLQGGLEHRAAAYALDLPAGGTPHALGRDRHLQMGNAEIAQRVDDGIGDDVERRGNATFAATMIGRYIRGPRGFSKICRWRTSLNPWASSTPTAGRVQEMDIATLDRRIFARLHLSHALIFQRGALTHDNKGAIKRI